MITVSGLSKKYGKFVAVDNLTRADKFLNLTDCEIADYLDKQEFLDLVGATNLIPGPNSTELAIHIGLRRAGGRGLHTRCRAILRV